MNIASPPLPTIGVFDSGVGGLSVLRALRARIPNAQLHYVADSAYSPYGDRSPEEVRERCQRLTNHLLTAGAKMVVVACNTATTLAIRELRSLWPSLPFVGVEPGIKPAVATSRSGRIGVLATRRTIASERLQSLLSTHASHCAVTLQACPGLADAIETGSLDDDAMVTLLQSFCEPLRLAAVDTVVLGCTHYPFVRHHIERLMGSGVELVDTADAVAQRAAVVWKDVNIEGSANASALQLESTGDPCVLSALARRWLGATEAVQTISI